MQRDLYSNIRRQNFFNANIASNTTTNGVIVDTTGFISGTVAYSAPAWTDGSYTLQIFESDDSGMAGETILTAIQMNGVIVPITAALVQGAIKSTIGIKWTKQYIRAKVVSSGVTTGARFVADLDVQLSGLTANPVLTT